MRWSDLPLNPSHRMLRQFAALWILFFGAVAGWQWLARDHRTAAIVYAAAALTLGPIGLAAPAVVRPIYVAWLVAAFPIGWVVSRVLLAVLFFGVVTPLAVLFRWRARDVLGLRRRDVDTYWTPKPPPAGHASYFRQS
jgi:Saxitoxin biosynthesis operon protein SxtJ